MKYLIIAAMTVLLSTFVLSKVFAFWIAFNLLRNYFLQTLISDDEKSERLCRLMKESTNCRIRLLKADAARKGKSSRPTPSKLRQLLFSLLSTAITAGVSVFVKSLVEGFLG